MAETTISYIRLTLKFLLILTLQRTSIQSRILQFFLKFLAIGNFIWMYSVLILFCFTHDDVVLKSECLTVLVNFIFAAFFAFTMIKHKSYINQIIKQLEEYDEISIKLSNTNFLKFAIKLLIVSSIAELFYLLSTFTVILYPAVKLGDAETLYITMHIPWKFDTPAKYMFALFYQIGVFVYPILVYFTLIFGLAAIVEFSHTELEKLLHSIKNLRCHDLPQQKIHADFLHIVKCYKIYKSSLNEITYVLTYISDLIIFAVTVCSIWDIANLTEAQIQFPRKIKSICVVLLMMNLLFTVSLMGEYIQQADNKIREHLYNTFWYRMSNEMKKNVNLLMLYTQKPTRVKAYGMIQINLNFSLSLLRKIFTVLNIYIAVFRNREA